MVERSPEIGQSVTYYAAERGRRVGKSGVKTMVQHMVGKRAEAPCNALWERWRCIWTR